jgi:uncharacterized membrane protein
MSHDKVRDASEDQSEQDQSAYHFEEVRLLVLVHDFITVCCTIFGTVLNSDIAKQLIRIRIATVVELIIVAFYLSAIEAKDCVNAA